MIWVSPRGIRLALVAASLAAVTPIATPVIWGVGAINAALLLLIFFLRESPARAPVRRPRSRLARPIEVNAPPAKAKAKKPAAALPRTILKGRPRARQAVRR